MHRYVVIYYRAVLVYILKCRGLAVFKLGLIGRGGHTITPKEQIQNMLTNS